MSDLTPAQENALRYAKYSAIADNYYCEVTDTCGLPTIQALVRKGYLHDCGFTFWRFWLTDKGELLRVISNGL